MADDYEASMSNVDVDTEMRAADREIGERSPTHWAWPPPAFVFTFTFGFAALIVGKNFLTGDATTAAYMAGMVSFLVAGVTGLLTLLSYYMVARTQPDGAWTPQWPFYAIGHIIVAPFVAFIFAVKLYAKGLYPTQSDG